MAFADQKIFTITGNFVHLRAQAATTPDVEQTLISSTVSSGFRREVWSIYVTSDHPGYWSAIVAGVIVASGRIAAGAKNSAFQYIPPKVLTAGQTLEVKFHSRAGYPTTEVEAYVSASDVPL